MDLLVEQLIAENNALRAALHNSPNKELLAAAVVGQALDELTKLGPSATLRVLTWAFARYGIGTHVYRSDIQDRRPAKQPVSPPSIDCKVCGKSGFKSSQGLAGHIVKMHPKDIS